MRRPCTANVLRACCPALPYTLYLFLKSVTPSSIFRPAEVAICGGRHGQAVRRGGERRRKAGGRADARALRQPRAGDVCRRGRRGAVAGGAQRLQRLAQLPARRRLAWLPW
jgi:hypothetical protein